MRETEIAIGAPMGAEGDVEGRDLTDCATNCLCGEEMPVDPTEGAGGLTAVDANNTQAQPVTEEQEGVLIDGGAVPQCEDECPDDRDDSDCEAVITEGCGEPLPGVGCDYEKEDKEAYTTDSKSNSIGKVELVLPDDGNALSYRGSRMFTNYNSNILQLVAKEDLHIKYYDGSEMKETTVPAGTRGGYVSKGFRVVNSWVDCSSIILETSLENSYVLDSTIFGRGYIEDSFVAGCLAENCSCLEIKKSSLVELRLEGEECLISKSFLDGGTISSSSIHKCRNLNGFEITHSKVEGVSGVSHFVVDGAGIKNLDEDFLQITSVGTSNRFLCAYKTPRGGVRVSTGCFRGTLEELAIANAQSHLSYHRADDGYLVRGRQNVSRLNEWCYKEYDMVIKYIRHHFKLDVNTMTIPTKY